MNSVADSKGSAFAQTKQVRNLVVLGSTGSIGLNTLDVVEQFPESYQIYALCAHSRGELLSRQAQKFRPRWVHLADKTSAAAFDESLLPRGTELLRDSDAIEKIVSAPEVDLVVSAIVGFAGLFGTIEALRSGKTVALANKESLVSAGAIVDELLKKHHGTIIPVDSEHSAVFQALAGQSLDTVERLVLTGSGGPFRGMKTQDLTLVEPQDALRHPTWKMGPKISIDSATLMNKAFEVIEARWLFNLPTDRIDVIIHPESIVHSFVEFKNCSILAQLSPPDMRLPIQYALEFPARRSGVAKRLDWKELRHLHFEQPDRQTFPALDLGYCVADRGGTAGAVLNAANEAAVACFLEGKLAFLDIAHVCDKVLNEHNYSPRPNLDEIRAVDYWARQEVFRWNQLQHRNRTSR